MKSDCKKSYLRQSVRRSLSFILPNRLFLTRFRGCRNSLFFTFDDGPHPEYTPRLLDEMARRQVRGSFFVVGECVERHPQIVRRMASEGHAVGNHTWSHADPRTVSRKALLQEMSRTTHLIADITGTAPTLFRPPHGKLTISSMGAVWRAGYTIALWNVDPKDYSCASAAEVLLRLAKWHPLGGDIVLLHDVHAHIDNTVKQLSDLARKHDPSIMFRTLAEVLYPHTAIDHAKHTSA